MFETPLEPDNIQPLDTHPTPMLATQLLSLHNKLRELNVITEDMCNIELPQGDHRTARLYLLFKVHKAGVPGSPVVSGFVSLT